MNIKDFLNEDMSRVQNIIDELDKDFDSHEFIEKFSHQHEDAYIRALYDALIKNDDNRKFQYVNRTIGRFLSVHKEDLRIKKNGRGASTNIFGDETGNQRWKKI